MARVALRSQSGLPQAMSGSSTATAVALEPVLESASAGRLTLLVCVLTSLALVFDGFDIQAIAFAAPRIIAEWGITRADLASVLAAGLVGMGVGALTLGDFGDRFGRRRALIACMVLIAVTSVMTSRAHGLAELGWWRLLTGIGLGGALPNATALMVEFAPTRVRNLTVALTVVGVPIGGMIGSAVAEVIVPAHGWAAIFVVGAALPAILAVIMAILLPESPRYLAVQPGRRGELAGLMNRVAGATRYDGSESWFLREAQADRPGIAALFSAEFLPNTLMIWMIFFANVFATYSFFNWTPTLLTGAGLTLGTALHGSLLFNLGGVVGSVAGALAMNRLGSRPVMTTASGFSADTARNARRKLLRHRMGAAGSGSASMAAVRPHRHCRCVRVRPTGADVQRRGKRLPDRGSRDGRGFRARCRPPRWRGQFVCGQRPRKAGRRRGAVLYRHCACAVADGNRCSSDPVSLTAYPPPVSACTRPDD